MHTTRTFSFEHHSALGKLVGMGVTDPVFSVVIAPLLGSVMICS